MENTLEGKRIIVSGGSGGIGRGLVEELVKFGAHVISVDVVQGNPFPNTEFVTVDLTNWDATGKALENIGPVDGLVNCAGTVTIKPITEHTEAEFQKQFDVNVKAMYRVTQIVVGEMLKADKGGSIVNISSQASQAALLDHTIYCATKGAVDGFTRALALEVGPKNIRVNAVNPTVVLTELGKRAWADPVKREQMKAKIPLQRFAEVQDVVDVILFLLSDKSSMITGSTVPIDGGFLAI